ncbi:NAD-dependent epimerase/dehydratase family protein [Fulvivirgaceae bacterium BMA10]|uniref:NAD-dependent epimerase/dehydratase family protein n=1 Tax=Splendidivirga corallicola TaxID=3051826 RepID=A0ABT8KKG2_9BACT|nr:NAD-dependent epimerase/dehydratase family protein [Fulvivirgaceae bacterium BMA10]
MNFNVSNKTEKILVTGSSGAIGSILCPFLQNNGYHVRGLDLQYGGITDEFLLGNIQDKKLINKAIQGIDAIIHLAASSDESDFQSGLLSNNVIGLKVLLEEAIKQNVKKIIFASSIQTVDFRQKDTYYTINDRSPFNHYGLSKVWGEDLLELLSKQKSISVIIARLGWFIRSEEEFIEAYRFPNGKDLYLSPNDLSEFFLRCLQKDNINFEKLYVTSIPINNKIFDLKLSQEKIDYVPKDTFPTSFLDPICSYFNSEEVNLIHITDTHIFGNKNGLLYGVNTFDKLKGIIQHLKKSIKKIDGLIITGDLSEDGSIDSYISLKEEIDKLSIPSFWLPGNHDNFENIPKEIASEHVHGSIKFSNWDLIFLDTTVKNEDFGLLSEKEFERLKQFLRNKQESKILICMHHPPTNVQSEFIDSIGLMNKEEFWELISKYSNIKGILIGHIHQAFNQEVGGIKILSPLSTCVQWKPLSKKFEYDVEDEGYQLIRLDSSGLISFNQLSNIIQPLNI